MFFKTIPGKKEEKNKLIHQVSEDRIPHAQLFIGREGSANLALAMAFVSYIYCQDRVDGDSCGVCAACKLTHKQIHPDVHFSFPVVKSESKKREDTTSDDFLPQWRTIIQQNAFFTFYDWQQAIHAQTTKPNINTKECNDIIQKLSYQSFSDGPKVLLMWMPEFLGKEGNKLLKLIEEPTDNTYLILVANDQDKILNTILSRCQLMKFLPFHEEELKDYLSTQMGLPNEAATRISRAAEGNIAKAVDGAKGADKNQSSMLFDWLRICYKGDSEEMTGFVNEMVGLSLDNQVRFLEYSLHFFETYLGFLLTEGKGSYMTEGEKTVAEKMKSIIDRQKVETISATINQLIFYLNRNGNHKVNWMADTIVVGDILRNLTHTSPNSRIFADEALLIT
ncbi:MAG TPA: hypothetical protein PLV12_14130 [Saprospiraceae bacterium]|nr:hypothetical protein [Saprospiraceae bacterium]